MQPTLQISDETGLLLALWPDDTVQVPQDADERARCYDQLSGALALLVDTVSSTTISATAGGRGLSVTRIEPHRCDCRADAHFSRPSGQREGSAMPSLRIVSSVTTGPDRSEHDPS